jgi:hypothetical protein
LDVGEAVIGGLIGGLIPALLAAGGFLFAAGRLQGTVTHLDNQVVTLGQDIKSLTGSISELGERLARLESTPH